jgi:outer membrane scaffolding protein for murein synthesis (MipA/OmpV family)
MTAAALILAPVSALAGDGEYFWSGDWYLKVGAAGFAAPRYQGAKSYLFQVSPMISLGKAGSTVRFSSRNDNPSFALIDNGGFRAGATGKLVMPRDEDDSKDLKGLTPRPIRPTGCACAARCATASAAITASSPISRPMPSSMCARMCASPPARA